VRFLDVDHVSKEFAGVSVFEDVAFSIAEGEFVTMIGHSGCGKSTLLNIIAGLEPPSAGGVVLSGREITGPGLDRMVVFQNFSLMPWMTVFENVRLAVRAAFPAWPRAEVHACVQRWITTVGLGGAESKRPAALSGGMRQRVGLARAFSTEPKVLLRDEPFTQIDALTRGVIQDELMRMWTASRNTVFMVTHDVDEAILLSDRIALMTSGPAARLADVVEVKLARPRRRSELIDDPEYLRLRTRILRFLVEGSGQGGPHG
jgi:nitrate/nitrite transport system ATP-binding protein